MTQLFNHQQPLATTRKLGANICLHYGNSSNSEHLRDGLIGGMDSRFRMGLEQWRNPYPEVDVILSEANLPTVPSVCKPPARPTTVQPLSFAIAPSLPCSFVSPDVVRHFFGRSPLPGTGCNVSPGPQGILFGHPIPIPYEFCSIKAYVQVVCSSLVEPDPVLPKHAFEFRVLQGKHIPPKTAVIGRNILDYMLILYRSRANHHALPGAKSLALFYLGRDSGEPAQTS